MRLVPAAFLTVLLGCRGARPSQPPPPPDEAAQLELQRVRGSESGEVLVAWKGGVPVNYRSPLCAIRVARGSVVCTVPATVASDEPGGFRIVGLSRSGRYLAVRLADQLKIYETEALRVVASTPLVDGAAGQVDFDPEETRAAWMLAGAPQLLSLANGERSSLPVLAATTTGSALRWLTDQQILVWGDGHPPTVARVDGSSAIVPLPQTAWDGSRVDLDPGRVQILREPQDTSRFELDVVNFAPAGSRVLTVRSSADSTEVGLFDLTTNRSRFVSTPGRAMFAGFSGDGSQVAWSNEDTAGDMAGADLFPSFTMRADDGDAPHTLGPVFLGWSGANMLVFSEYRACLRVSHESLFCRDQSWAPFPETDHAGHVLWIGGDHILRVGTGDARVTELHVTGTVERPVLHVQEHVLKTPSERPDEVLSGVSEP